MLKQTLKQHFVGWFRWMYCLEEIVSRRSLTLTEIKDVVWSTVIVWFIHRSCGQRNELWFYKWTHWLAKTCPKRGSNAIPRGLQEQMVYYLPSFDGNRVKQLSMGDLRTYLGVGKARVRLEWRHVVLGHQRLQYYCVSLHVTGKFPRRFQRYFYGIM